MSKITKTSVTRAFAATVGGVLLCSTVVAMTASAVAQTASHPPIPIRFRLPEKGFVTLVIEDTATGKRVRNLVSETPFPAGANTAWWDGTDDLGRDTDAARHGVYHIPAALVMPGKYRVRGLWHTGIGLKYEFSVYNSGTPAWKTEDRTGGWLSDHTPPSGVLFVPQARAKATDPLRPAVLVGSHVSEGGSGLVWLDPATGRKYHGQVWLGGVWTAASFLARDNGPKAVPGVYAYAAAAWDGDKYNNNASELRLHALLSESGKAPSDKRFGTGVDRPVLTPTYKYPERSPSAEKGKFTGLGGDTGRKSDVSGLAAYNGVVVAALGSFERLLLVDAREGKVLGEAPLASPRGLTFDNQGRLLALSGKLLLRFTIDGTKLSSPTKLVTTGLDDPQGITVDTSGAIYVSDRGESHQVKVFSDEGKFVRAIGHPGVPKAGPYDPLHMNNPQGITLDGDGRLWVAEEDYLPRRVSLWDPKTGKLLRSFFGPSEYGGGGTLDPSDKNRFYYHGMEFALDWTAGKDQPTNILYRPDENSLPLPWRSGPPETPLYVNGIRYLTNCYTSNPTNGTGIALLWRMEAGKAIPVAGLGRANEWDLLKTEPFRSRWPQGLDPMGDKSRYPALFSWSDTNDDGNVQPDEVTIVKAKTGGVTVLPDLSFVESRVEDRAVQFAPTRFTARGAPVYDLAKAKVLSEGAQSPVSSGGDQVLLGTEGWTVLTVAPKPFAPQGLGGVRNGVPVWSYPSPWPGLHASHESPAPDRPGEVIGATRLLGGWVTPKKGEAGPLFAINGNQGPMYLFTQDGLFISQIFQDVRQGKPWAMPVATRGMDLNDVSPHDENFWPSIAGTADGNVYVVDGGRSSLVRVEGLDSVHRIAPMDLNVTPNDLKLAQAYVVESEAARQASLGSGELTVALRPTAPTVDGKLDDWTGADWAIIDKSGVKAFFNSKSLPYDIAAALTVSGDRLYAAFRTGNPDLLKNSGSGGVNSLFKTGGALDLMLSTAQASEERKTKLLPGDLRLLVTQVDGKTAAALYRGVVPGTKEPVAFSSPWRTITLDRVEDVSDQITLAGDGTGNYELSVPLSLLGLTARAGQSIRGDVGILRGDGLQTVQRVYWNNKATGIVSDVPSEAELTPRLWGTLHFGNAGKEAKK